MAKIKREEHSDNPIEKVQPNNDQEWFDSQGDYDSGETLKARSWETEHRLADDNSALGNIHQGTDEAQDFQKGEDTSIHFVTDPKGIELPAEPEAQEKALPADLTPSASAAAVDQTGGVDTSPLPNSGGEYQAPDFGNLSIEAIDDTTPELGVEQNEIREQQNSSRQNADNNEIIQQEPTAAVISGEGGWVVEDEQSAVSGQLAIIDPDSGEAAFQAGVVKGNYGSFDLAIDGSWFYRLAISQENVQSLANGELASEVIEISSVDGTTHQLEITVRGTNDAPVFTSVTSQTFTEDDQIVSGQVSAIDIDQGDAITFSTDTAVSGLEFNADGSYQFDPGHEDYQHLAAGESMVLNIPVTATDLQGAETQETLVLRITGTDDAPTISFGTATSMLREGGLVIEDAQNTVSGQLNIIDPDSGEAAFQGGIVKGNYGSFDLSTDGSWSYQLAISQENVQSLANGELTSEVIEISSVDGTTHQLEITVRGTNDAPVFTSVTSQTFAEDDPIISGQVSAIDIDHGDVITYSTDKLISGLQFNADGSYHFDPGHADYQHLGTGESMILNIPVTATDLQGAATQETLVFRVTGTNEAPTISFGNYQEVLQESFENFRSSDGWHIAQGIGADNEVIGDHGVLWSLTDEGLEVQRGNIGGSRASDGESHIEMDGHSNLSLSTKITTIEDQNYTVIFAYKARPGKTDSSDMKVSFGGRELNIDTDATGVTTLSSEDNITWQVNDAADGWKTITASFPDMDGGSESELVFTGTGKSDSLGAYVDDIHLGYSVPSDQYITTFVEGGFGTPIVDNQFMLSDVDDTAFEGANIVLKNGTQNDQLVIGDLPDGIHAQTSLSSEGAISIQLTGSAPFADYQQALQQIRFVNTSDFPDTTDRSVEITVTDGNDNSDTVVTEIQVIGVNDAPIGTDTQLATMEDQSVTLGVADFGFQDSDGGQLSAVRFTEDAENGSLMLDGDPVEPGQSISVDVIEAGRLVFTPVHHGSGEGFGSFFFQVNDGVDWSVEPTTVDIDISAVADVPELSAELAEARLVPVPGTGDMVTRSIDVNNYQETGSGFSVLGRTVDSDGNLTEASLDNVGTGAGGFAPGGQNAGPSYQLGVDLEHQVSEELIIQFDNTTSEASVSVNRLFANEGGRGGHEAGFYTLLNGDEVVGEGEFFTNSGHTIDLTLTGTDNAVFDQIVFTAKATYQDGSTKSGDASDYVITGVQWQAEENCDMVWETPLVVSSNLVDADGSETLDPVLVEGIPPGAFLSAGEMIGGGEPADYQATTIGIKQDSPARVIFEGEDAGYRSSLGYYKIDPESGKIGEVEMMWDNASLQGSGGSLIGGESAIDLDISAGDQIGFFLVADGSRKNNFGNLGAGHYEFQESDGSDATITSSVPKLIFVGEDGSETQISGHIYHSGESDENYSLNPDGMKHANGELDLENGSITVGFEDLKGGGDQDYNDSIFSVEIGVENTQALADENAGYSTWQVESENLEGLTLTIPSENNEPFDLSVSSVSTESTGGSAFSSVTLSVNYGDDGPYVLEPEPSVELQSFDVQGVSLNEAGMGDQVSGQADLESFAATEANGQSGLPESLNQFSSTENGSESEDVPSLDEQAAAFEQEMQEQQSNGLGEQDMIINDDNDGITGGQEDQPVV